MKTTSTKEITMEERIVEWKKQYKNIYKNTIDGIDIYWRAVKRSEYKDLLNANEDIDTTTAEGRELKILAKQESMVKTVVLFPDNIEELIEEKAGIATVLSDEILDKSGFYLSETESV